MAVVGWELTDKLFKGADPIGKDIVIEGLPYRVVGKVEIFESSGVDAKV